MAITTIQNYSSPSSQDPSGVTGFTGAGSGWFQTDTGIVLVRNSSNSAWVTIGSGNQANFGLLPLAGGAMSGAITGSHGLETADGNTPFATAPTVTNRNSLVATMADLTNLQNSLNVLISTEVASAIAGIPSPGIRSNMRIIVGTYNASVSTTLGAPPANVAIFPLITGATYPDGSTVNLSDCIGFASQNTDNWLTNAGDALSFYLIQADTQGMTWQSWTQRGASTGYWAASFNYIVIAIKPNA